MARFDGVSRTIILEKTMKKQERKIGRERDRLKIPPTVLSVSLGIRQYKNETLC